MINELTIGGTTYSFRFGFGFMREINRTVKVPVNGVPGMSKDTGLRYSIAGLMDGDPDELVRVLDIANKGQDPRLNRADLEAYIEDDETDIDALFETVLDFLERANCCRKTVTGLKEAVEKAKKG